MLMQLDSLRDSLLAARLLREEIHLAPVSPDEAVLLRGRILATNGGGPSGEFALAAALRLSTTFDGVAVERSLLEELSRAAGAGGLRQGTGDPVLGRPAPPARSVRGLLDEVLEEINAPAAVEGWPPPARAFALHFLLRLVHPFEGPAGPLARAAEALLLAVDGFAADRMFLPGDPPETAGSRPDADAFVRLRTLLLPARLGETLDLLRESAARAVLARWAGSRAAGLNARQRSLVAYLLADPARSLSFRDFVGLHAGRAAPSLRTLQRDWRGLRAAGLLGPAVPIPGGVSEGEPGGGGAPDGPRTGYRLTTAGLAFGG